MACLKFGTLWAVKETIKTFEDISFCKFIQFTSSKAFSDDEWRPPHKINVHWEKKRTGIYTPSIPFDGTPFMLVGHRYMSCQHDLGKKRNSLFFGPTFAKAVDKRGRKKIRTMGSKKIGCPALIRLTKIAKFPQFKLSGKITNNKKREVVLALMESLLEKPSFVKWKYFYYVCLPPFTEHAGHPIALQTEYDSTKNRNHNSLIVEDDDCLSLPSRSDLMHEYVKQNTLKKQQLEYAHSSKDSIENIINDNDLAILPNKLDGTHNGVASAFPPNNQCLFSLNKPVNIIIESNDVSSIKFSNCISPDIIEVALHDDIMEE